MTMPVAGLIVNALRDAVSAVAPLDSLAYRSPGKPPFPSGHVVERADGSQVKIDYAASATAQQILQGDDAAFTLSLDPAALALALRRRLAKEFASTREDEYGQVVRALALVAMDEDDILRRQVVAVATQTWDPASIASGAGLTSPSVNVTPKRTTDRIRFGDVVLPTASYSLQGLLATAYVSAESPGDGQAGQVQVRLHNSTPGAVNLASGVWKVVVWRPEEMGQRTAAQARQAVADRAESLEAD